MITLLHRIALWLRRWATYQRVRAELDGYNDRELNDMGISRADITRIALEAASLVKSESKAQGERRSSLLRQRYASEL